MDASFPIPESLPIAEALVEDQKKKLSALEAEHAHWTAVINVMEELDTLERVTVPEATAKRDATKDRALTMILQRFHVSPVRTSADHQPAPTPSKPKELPKMYLPDVLIRLCPMLRATDRAFLLALGELEAARVCIVTSTTANMTHADAIMISVRFFDAGGKVGDDIIAQLFFDRASDSRRCRISSSTGKFTAIEFGVGDVLRELIADVDTRVRPMYNTVYHAQIATILLELDLSMTPASMPDISSFLLDE